MVTNDHIEVHIVASSDGRQLAEYDDPKASASSDRHLLERFIEATTGLIYRIEVKVKPEFELFAADGISFNLNIDGEVVNQSVYYGRVEVEKRQRTGSPFIDSWAMLLEGSLWRKLTYTFGSLKIGKSRERLASCDSNNVW